MVAREQFAWVWLLTMIVTYAGYFTAVALAGDASFWAQIWMFAATTVIQVIVIAVGSAVIALRRRRGPEADERDRAISRRAGSIAYMVLLSGIILVGCILPFSQSGWRIFHAAVFVIAAAEIIRHALIVSMYRRGWHG